jgi:hypothetical protein
MENMKFICTKDKIQEFCLLLVHMDLNFVIFI